MVIRALKLWILALLALLAGCTWADQDLIAGPPPIIGFTIGAILNAAGLLLKRRWPWRLIAVALVAFVGRFTPLFGAKLEGFHLEVVGGAMLVEWFSWLWCRGPCERKWRKT